MFFGGLSLQITVNVIWKLLNFAVLCLKLLLSFYSYFHLFCTQYYYYC